MTRNGYVTTFNSKGCVNEWYTFRTNAYTSRAVYYDHKRNLVLFKHYQGEEPIYEVYAESVLDIEKLCYNNLVVLKKDGCPED